MTPLRQLSLAASALILSACQNLAPLYERPQLDIPAELPAGQSGTTANLYWNDLVTSPELQQVITLALDNNPDLDAAAANVRATRAAFRATRAGLFPTLGLSGGLTEGGSFDSGGSADAAFADSSSLTVGVNAWQLDLFGQIENQSQSDLETYFSTAYGEQSARLALVGAVMQTWLQLAADRELLALAEQTMESQQESLDLTRQLLEFGTATELDVRRASTSVETARSQAALYRTLVAQDLNLLRQLAGTEISPAVTSTARLTPFPLETRLETGASSELLLNRPDVQAAEAALRASYADIGAVRASFFPSVSLTGSAGYVSADISDLLDASSGGWSFGPAISLPVLDAGVRQSTLEASEAARDAALASYQSTVQTAFREAADALATAEQIDIRVSALAQLQEDADVIFNLSQERFRAGLDDYLNVLDAQRTQYSAAQQLIAIRQAKAQNIVNLYLAMGVWPQSDLTPPSDPEISILPQSYRDLTQTN